VTPRPSHLAIVINPISGAHGSKEETGRQRVALAKSLAAAAGVTIDVEVAQAPHHAIELARAFVARGADVVLAWGGDGTANEVAGPLIGTRTALGLIPSGSGDGFALSLRLPRDPRAAFARAIAGGTSAVDVGYLGARHFLNVAGIGFDAAVGLAFNRGKKRGLWRYIGHASNLMWRYEARHYDVALDDRTLDGRHFMIAFANGCEYGNHLVLAPDANPCDGWLDAVVVAPGSPLQQFWKARRLTFSPKKPARGIHRMRVRAARVTSDLLMCHVDGETFETSGTVEIRIEAGALLVKT